MKLETILNAMDHAKIKLTHAFKGISDASVEDAKRYSRQHLAFRARILRMDAEKDERIKEMEDVYVLHQIRMGNFEKKEGTR